MDSTLVKSCQYGCSAGACRDTAECQEGLANCDGEPGCETDVSTSATSCGECGNACSDLPNTDGSCTDAKCNCKASYADCTMDPGCETNTDSDTANCGQCGHACEVGSCVAGSCPWRVFVTSQSYNGDLGGLSGADAKCQALADAAHLNGTFRAWLGDLATPISQRFQPSTVPYVRVDGTVVASDWTALTTAKLQATITVDETGQDLPMGTVSVWTGYKLFFCNNWTDGTNAEVGAYGNAWSATYWQAATSDFCSEEYHLYCFEVAKQ